MGAWLAVMALAATTLAGLDRLPSVASGTPHGVRVFDSIDSAERELGVRVWLPSAGVVLGWPPDRVEADAANPPTLAIHFPARVAGQPEVLLCESMGRVPRAAPEVLLPPGRTLESAEIQVGGRPAHLARLVGDDGRVWHELGWDLGSRHITLRSGGPVDWLLEVAGGVEQGHR